MNRVFLLIFFLSFIYIPAVPQTAVLHPLKDNTMFSENGAASNGAGMEYFVGRTGAHAAFSRRRALVQFDLVSIPAGSAITGVTLSVTCTKAPPAGSRAPNPVELHKCLVAWGEGSSSGSGGAGATASPGDATWTCCFANGTGSCTQAWTTAGGDFSPVISSAVTLNDTGTYTFLSSPTLVADVQSWVDTPSSNFGWLLSGDEITPFSTRAFSSREGDVAATTLTVIYSDASCTNNTWTGAINSAWETPGNWSCGMVPGNNTNVIINSGTVVLNSNVVIRSLILSAGVNFTVNSGFKLTVTY